MAGAASSLCLTVVGGDYINGLLGVGGGGWTEMLATINRQNLRILVIFLKHGRPKHMAHTLWKYAYKLNKNKRGDRPHATLNKEAL